MNIKVLFTVQWNTYAKGYIDLSHWSVGGMSSLTFQVAQNSKSAATSTRGAFSDNIAALVRELTLENEKMFAKVQFLDRSSRELEKAKSALEDDNAALRNLLDSSRGESETLRELQQDVEDKDEEIRQLHDQNAELQETIKALRERFNESRKLEEQQAAAAPVMTKKSSALDGSPGIGGSNPALVKELQKLKTMAMSMEAALRRLNLNDKPRSDWANAITLNRQSLEKLKSTAIRTSEAATSSFAHSTPPVAPASPAASGATGASPQLQQHLPELELVSSMLRDIVLASCKVCGDFLDTITEVTVQGPSASAAPPQTPRSGGWLHLTK